MMPSPTRGPLASSLQPGTTLTPGSEEALGTGLGHRPVPRWELGRPPALAITPWRSLGRWAVCPLSGGFSLWVENGSRVVFRELWWWGGWETVFMWLLALAWCCPRLSSPQALPSPSGSQAAASGLCPDQCILKANGNNVMSDGAPEVPEHLQAFRSHWEEALGPYQWAYQTHKDVQEAWEAHREDPNDEGAGEEDQPNSGKWTEEPLCLH
uniref:Uncharacterized protein LOC123613035 n=1 Tax=Camelus bactrianus TaxID=9837 RepID=A0A9W3H9H2_CAMBA|nr:uncharacterized protein LOC123613035 [Camelus bactrianus]